MKRLFILFIVFFAWASPSFSATPKEGASKSKTAQKIQNQKEDPKANKKIPGKRAERCLAELDSIKKLVPAGASLANITWAEARARADQLERFEREMPKSDLLPYFTEACSLYVRLITLYAEKEELCRSTESVWKKRLDAAKEIEATQKGISELRSGKLSSLSADLEAARTEAAETSEEAKKREEEMLLQAKAREDSLKLASLAREDSLRRASELREAELERALAEEREKAEARQKEARAKLNELQSKLIQVTEDARGIILSMSDILFDIDQASLKQDLKTSLAKVAGILSVYQELNVSVEGHTDNTGSALHNLKLSEQRAKNVMDFLVSQGIDSSRLSSKGFGMTRPIGDNKTKEGRQKNRRVDLVIQDKVLQAK